MWKPLEIHQCDATVAQGFTCLADGERFYLRDPPKFPDLNRAARHAPQRNNLRGAKNNSWASSMRRTTLLGQVSREVTASNGQFEGCQGLGLSPNKMPPMARVLPKRGGAQTARLTESKPGPTSYVWTVSSFTMRKTPGASHAASCAVERSAKLPTVPRKVAVPASTSTSIFFASSSA